MTRIATSKLVFLALPDGRLSPVLPDWWRRFLTGIVSLPGYGGKRVKFLLADQKSVGADALRTVLSLTITASPEFELSATGYLAGEVNARGLATYCWTPDDWQARTLLAEYGPKFSPDLTASALTYTGSSPRAPEVQCVGEAPFVI